MNAPKIAKMPIKLVAIEHRNSTTKITASPLTPTSPLFRWSTARTNFRRNGRATNSMNAKKPTVSATISSVSVH